MILNSILMPAFSDSFKKLMAGGILKVPAKDAFRLKKISQKIEQEVTIFEEVRKQIAADLAFKDEQGNAIIENGNYQLSDENKAILNTKLAELLNVEIDLGEKFPFESFEKLDLSINDLVNLDALINEPV